MEKFDYPKAIAELEEIARLAEDPATPLGDLDKYIKRSDELITLCREYLRTTRTKIDKLAK